MPPCSDSLSFWINLHTLPLVTLNVLHQDSISFCPYFTFSFWTISYTLGFHLQPLLHWRGWVLKLRFWGTDRRGLLLAAQRQLEGDGLYCGYNQGCMRRKPRSAVEVSTDVVWSSVGGVGLGWPHPVGSQRLWSAPESPLSTSDLVPPPQALPVHEH